MYKLGMTTQNFYFITSGNTERIEEYEKRIKSLQDTLSKEKDRRHQAEDRTKSIIKMYEEGSKEVNNEIRQLQEFILRHHDENRKKEREEAMKREEKLREEASKRERKQREKRNAKERIIWDRVSNYINKCIIKDPDCRLQQRHLNESFRIWYQNQNYHEYINLSRNALIEYMEDTFNIDENSHWVGVGIKYDDPPISLVNADLFDLDRFEVQDLDLFETDLFETDDFDANLFETDDLDAFI
jgi:hypothetical protein